MLFKNTCTERLFNHERQMIQEAVVSLWRIIGLANTSVMTLFQRN